MLHWNKNLNSQIVADVWGKGVLAFEYHFDYKKENINLDDFTRQKLAAELDEYAKKHHLKDGSQCLSTVYYNRLVEI